MLAVDLLLGLVESLHAHPGVEPPPYPALEQLVEAWPDVLQTIVVHVAVGCSTHEKDSALGNR